MAFLALLLIPMLVAAGFFVFGKSEKVTLKELAAQMLAQVIIAAGSVGIIYQMNVGDTEVWNGRVANKTRDRVSCSHSYQCNCYQSCSGSGSKRSCSTICQTCYEHLYDVSWFLTTTNSERIYISRVNRQGTIMPPRYASAKIGEPTAVSHSFDNYVKGSSGSLFKKQGLANEFAAKLPKHPNVYDYHRSDRALGFPRGPWQSMMAELNADVGPKKEVNVILVATSSPDQRYGLALEEKWIGGKQNEAVIVVGLDKKSKEVRWSYVFGWAKNDLFNIKMRDAMVDLKTMNDPAAASTAIRQTVSKHFKRKSMEDYAYLKAGVQPTMTQWLMAMLVGLFVSLGLGYWFYKEDVFNDEGRARSRNYRNRIYGNNKRF